MVAGGQSCRGTGRLISALRWSISLVLALSIATGALAQNRQNNTRRDGNEWLTLSHVSKLDYITGFFDGMQLGHQFSYWKYVSDQSKAETVGLVFGSFNEFSAKYFSNVTSGQIVSGLDVFYADFQNRQIMVYNAVWIVVNQIAGTPTVNQMILGFRQNAQ